MNGTAGKRRKRERRATNSKQRGGLVRVSYPVKHERLGETKSPQSFDGGDKNRWGLN